MIKIRKARIKDATRINEINTQNWKVSFHGIYSENRINNVLKRRPPERAEKRFLKWRRKGSLIYVAVLGKDILGFILCRKNPKTLFIGSLYVDRKYQRKGIGSRLIKFIERKTKSKTYTVTSANKKETIKFYEKHGFRKLRITRKGKDIDIIMIKRVRD